MIVIANCYITLFNILAQVLQYIRGLEKRIQELEDEKLNSKQMVIKLHMVLYF